MSTPKLDPLVLINAKLEVIETKIDILLKAAGLSQAAINKLHREAYKTALDVLQRGTR
jgi:hypothetical protein